MTPFDLKLIASDLDGTLLKNHRWISPANHQALLKAHQAGIKIAIATGRPYQLVKQIRKELPFVDAFILNNGASIYQPAPGRMVFEKHLDETTVQALIDYANTHAIDLEIHTHDALYIKGATRWAYFNEFIESFSPGTAPILKDILDYHPTQPATKVMFIEPDKTRYEALKSTLQSWQDVSVIQSQKAYVDINVKGVSKGDALTAYAELTGISPDQIMAIGDQENDISMLRVAHIGVAMGNATAALKAEATTVTGTPEEDGVAQAITPYLP